MPLMMVSAGETVTIKRIKGNDETKQFVEKLGFVVGSEITVVSKTGGNMIVKVKDARVAVTKDMAMRIMV